MTTPWSVTVLLTDTVTRDPLNAGDLVVVHVDRKGVVCPTGWTRNAAQGATGEFFWRFLDGEETTVHLVALDGLSFTVDTMALRARPVFLGGPWARPDGSCCPGGFHDHPHLSA